MIELSVRITFSAAHRLREYEGPCSSVHGHNWQVEARVRAEKPGPQGIVLDFAEFRHLLREAIEPLDHALINDIPPFDRINPSSENIAAWIYGRLRERLAPRGVELVEISVSENAYSTATYRE